MIDVTEHTRHTTAEIELMKRYCTSTLNFIRNLYAGDERAALERNESSSQSPSATRLIVEGAAISRWESEGGARAPINPQHRFNST